jgi:PhzF family phenazine biosynthesis protein
VWFHGAVKVSTGTRIVEVEIVAAFTRDGAGGNLAGVVLDAESLAHEQRQRVATAVDLSETAFVTPRGEGVFEVAFYTRSRQIADCGHATVATFGLLARRGAIPTGLAVKRLPGGDQAIRVEGERVFMEQARASVRPYASAAEIAPLLGLEPADVLGEPAMTDNGVRFVHVATTRAAMARIAPDHAVIAAFTEPPDVIGLYVTAPGEGASVATARMFGAGYGIPEEPATGLGAGSYGSLRAGDAPTAEYQVEQGAIGPEPSPSELIVRVEPNRVIVGGTTALLRTQRVDLSDGGEL